MQLKTINTLRVHSIYARLGAVRWTYRQQKELQDRGSRGELMRAWDDVIITRRNATADVWSIDKAGQVMMVDGTWVIEPMPSSRSDAHVARTRFALQQAIQLCVQHGLWQDSLQESP